MHDSLEPSLTVPATGIPGWMMDVDSVVKGLERKLLEIRRHLHRNPEPSGEEWETTRYLAGILGERGLACKLGKDNRGVMAGPATTGNAQSTTAFRGDIDALWIHETTGASYQSCVEGVMHACGHDGHATCAVGTALALVQLQEAGQLPWPVDWRAILQPAEEICVGAAEMVEAGALDGVSGIFSLHMDPAYPVGTICTKDRALTAACDEFRIQIHGEGGHGARPHETRDPVAAGAMLVSSLYQQIPRTFDAQDTVVVTVGEFSAGHSANVIADAASLRGTFRTLSFQNREALREKIREIAGGISHVTGCGMEVTFPIGCPGVDNNPGLTNLVRQAAKGIPEGIRVNELERSSMGGEDFAEYLEHVPGSMFRLGCQPANGCTTLHSPDFDIDERALAIGVRLLTRAVILHANPNR